MSKRFLVKSVSERHASFDTSLVELSSMTQTNSSKVKFKPNQPHYVLLDWNNRQSLLNFLQTIHHNQHLSNMPIEQLRQLITNHDQIHLFNSIIDLILTITKQQHRLSLCDIYIDPVYYSTIPDTVPFSQSYLMADNINLNRTLHNIQQIARHLGAKIDQSTKPFSFEKVSIKQRKSILNEQMRLITSKLPNHTFRHTSIHTTTISSIKYV